MTQALLLAALAAAAPLFARASEDWFGLAPCELCLWQRWPYWAAAALAVAAALWPRGRRVLVALAVLAVLGSGAVAAFHVGVEQGWWPSPLAGCQVPRSAGGSVEDMLRGLSARPSKPCDAPAYLIPGLPLSMAAMNLLYALGLSAGAAIWMRRGARP
ncbi:disulfide bond formation protein B [Paracraurococcus ruber]|uniref:Disulfide bond formation protein B n=1 Tax=Paracraurococcus ruber TaxID=77675 RepID=A0ABS1D4V1_9PROT|nr:disulfide bond formation protein B [Paracraurococcus ruber]MBK1661723.1 disulfide bond formation protein B [Paracraurococcus ruber]TDG30953.1 disulfide bond formation protein B [Paracraurococcus ruber]